MRPVSVLIFHAPATGSGPYERLLVEARAALAEEHRRRFLAAGADAVRAITEPGSETTFGDRLRRALDGGPGTRSGAQARETQGGVVILGSGALPLARTADLRRFIEAAAAPVGTALANSRWSSDVIAVSDARVLRTMPPLRGDNEVPRWLAEQVGVTVTDLHDRWRLQVDLDSPLDVVIAARDRTCAPTVRAIGAAALAADGLRRLRRALAGVARVMADPGAELVVVGRTSATTLRWLETHTRCRVRAIVEERGLRAGGGSNRRPPRSILGRVLEIDGPEGLARELAQLGDAAIVDSRVLLAHRLGADERDWPVPEDRFASDLLEPQAIADPWLRALTESAATGGLPILLGGHSLVGPAVHLLGRGLHE